MTTQCTVCPSCKEKNNPTFSKCWKCGYWFIDSKLAQPSASNNLSTKTNKNNVWMTALIWFLAGLGSLRLIGYLFAGEFNNLIPFVVLISLGCVLIFWKKYKKEEQSCARNVNEKEVQVKVIDGYWICPLCNEKSQATYDACRNCGQPVIKK